MVSVSPIALETPWQEIRSTADDWDQMGETALAGMHWRLHLVRAFEETLIELEAEGLLHGPAHTSIGQEGGAIGAIALLRSGDLITGSHRGHHQFLAKGLNHLGADRIDPVAGALPDHLHQFIHRSMAEICGLEPGFGHGRGGSMHLRWAEAGAMGTNAIVGGGVPLAAGMAWARKRRGEGDVVFTFFGDGAANIGAVPETMNLASLWRLPICFFIENNGYAVATSLAESTHDPRISSRALGYGIPSFRVDGMDPVAVRLATAMALDIMRSGKGPVAIEAAVYRYLHHSGGLPGSAFGYRSKAEEAAWRERDPIVRITREMSERGWMDAERDQLIRNRMIAAMKGSAGRLTEPEDNRRRIIPALWPDPAIRDQGIRGDLSEFLGVRFEELESASGPVGEIKFIDAVAGVITRRMEQDERIIVLGEDIHQLKGGTNGATRGLAKSFPDRIVPTPIEEQAFVGLGGGIALEGTYRPVVELMYADFSLVAADQLFNQIAKARHMYGADSPVPLVLRTKCAIGTGYGSQHSMDPAGLFAAWPGWRIVAPSTPFDYVGLMNSALLCEDPVLMIEHVGLYTTDGPGPLEDHDYFIPLGKAKVVRPGERLTVLTYLAMVPLAIQVADKLDLDIEIIDLRSLDRAGLDWDTIGQSIRKTNNVLVLEQGSQTASYGAMLTDEIQRRFFDWLDAPVGRVCGGEASPTVSKVLERAAFVGPAEIETGFAAAFAEIGLRLDQARRPT